MTRRDLMAEQIRVIFLSRTDTVFSSCLIAGLLKRGREILRNDDVTAVRVLPMFSPIRDTSLSICNLLPSRAVVDIVEGYVKFVNRL